VVLLGDALYRSQDYRFPQLRNPLHALDQPRYVPHGIVSRNVPGLMPQECLSILQCDAGGSEAVRERMPKVVGSSKDKRVYRQFCL
jgi:hypothetical protein